jgi:hypothetical protein
MAFGGEIKNVQFFRNGVSLATDTRAPYETNWRNVPPGQYRLTAVANDKSGNRAESAPVTITVGAAADGDRLANGEFMCANWPWTWNIYAAEGRATFTLDPESWIADSTAAVIDVENGGTEAWHIQLQQPLPVDSGHTYIVSFAAVSIPPKTINFSFQENQEPWVEYFHQEVNVDQLSDYGPFVFDCAKTDPGAYIRFNVGRTPGVLILDQIRVIDPSVTGLSEGTGPGLPGRGFTLAPAFPNPSNGAVALEIALDRPARAAVEVLDLRGRRLRLLDEGQWPAGIRRVRWDASDGSSRPVTSGLYLFRARVDDGTGERTAVRKIMIAR